MGCKKLTYHERETTIGKNWKIFVGGIEKRASGEKKCLSYYAFGSVMPNANNLNAAGHTYGFNGMMNDNEIKNNGNSVDFGARMYDPRLGRWFATDSYEQVFVPISPYAYAFNNPINYIDLEGMWPGHANLMIIIGTYKTSTVLKQGDWTIVRANSLEEAAKLMHSKKLKPKSFNNLYIAAHGLYDNVKKQSEIGVSGDNSNRITNTSLSNKLTGKLQKQNTINLLAFQLILNYLGTNPEIAFSSCQVAKSDEFTQLIYDFIDSKFNGDFTLYMSSADVYLLTSKKNGVKNTEPLFGVDLIYKIDTDKGDGYKKIDANNQSEETYNMVLNETNPILGNIFKVSSINSIATKVTATLRVIKSFFTPKVKSAPRFK